LLLQRISHTFSLHCQTTDSASLGVPIELALPIMDVQAVNLDGWLHTEVVLAYSSAGGNLSKH